jgi:UDP-2-acetamido-2-deoxy-ribo-hexuluronate aminotransferase
LMALGLNKGDEVIVPSFTYVATAEVIALLGLTPVMIDVDPDTFNITAELVSPAITDKTKVIIPVHLFGQCTDMQGIIEVAKQTNIRIIEDTAQSLGAIYRDTFGEKKMAGTIGDIGTTSFFPSKNLGCYGDGGALFTDDEELAEKIKMIANHGQRKKYHHEILGVNSRLDTIQAAVLGVKLEHLDEYCEARNAVASYYDRHLRNIPGLIIPVRNSFSTHVFHQYTIRVTNGKRNDLQAFLKKRGIPSMIYYPLPLFEQEAFKNFGRCIGNQNTTKMLCEQVLSLPIHTELNEETLAFIVKNVKSFFYEQ